MSWADLIDKYLGKLLGVRNPFKFWAFNLIINFLRREIEEIERLDPLKTPRLFNRGELWKEARIIERKSAITILESQKRRLHGNKS